MTDEKSTIREQAKNHLRLMNVLEEEVDQLPEHFFDNVEIRPDDVIAAYWPLGREIDPTGILEEAVKRGLSCALPIVEKGTKVLSFKAWEPKTEMHKGAFGIMEPKDSATVIPDIVLVPLLAFDRQGHRMGKGGGYYDATLSHLRGQKEIQAIGVGYAGQAVLFNLPKEAHDQKMDAILTPKEFKRFA